MVWDHTTVRVCSLGLCFCLQCMQPGHDASWCKSILPFYHILQCGYSNGHKDRSPNKDKIAQLKPVSPGLMAQKWDWCMHADRGRRTQKSRLQEWDLQTHSDTLPKRQGFSRHALMNIHTQESRRVHLQTHAHQRSDRRTQQWCIDFQRFFDEMSYSDSLPRCYFA